MTRELCGRCGSDRDVRLTLANLAREARLEKRQHTGPDFDHAYRCRPCRDAVRTPR